MSNFAVQRENMVESQVRTSDVTDRRIIRAMGEIAREAFFPASLRSIAYTDRELTVSASDGTRRQMVSPMALARLIQLCEIESHHVVLDIGCTLAYSTAIIAQLAESVVGLESDQGLCERATSNLTSQGIDNAAIVSGPLARGCADDGPFDVILIAGMVEQIPDALQNQLRPGGRLVCVMSENGVGVATVCEPVDGRWSQRRAFSLSAPPVPGFQKAPAFVF